MYGFPRLQPHRGYLLLLFPFSALLGTHLICVVAGADESPYQPPRDIDVRPGFVLDKVTLTERQIPTLFLSKDDGISEKKPIVIALHGGGMPEVLDAPGMTAKEAWFLPEEFDGAPYTLANAGCMVVIFDAWWAGERYRPEFRGTARENPANAVVLGWTETARDVGLVIDALAEVPTADTSRVGLCGRSGGAIAALMAARRDARVKAVVSWAGCADVEAFLRTKAPPEMAEKLLSGAPDARKRLKEFDPIYDLNALPPRPILLISNRQDPAVPAALAEAFYRRLRPLYGSEDERIQLRLRDAPEPTHKMAEQDFQEGCVWLIEHLVGAEATGSGR